MSRKKELRPMWTTTVDPSEYDYQDQFADCVKIANREETWFLSMDIGKVWGLVQSHVRLERENAELERENAALREKMKVSWDEISVLVNQNSALLEALKTIAKYDQNSPHGDGICPYGCDCPSIANTALIKARKEAQP
jgi:hypothetical protein